MTKSVKVHQQRKVGRPATGRHPAVTVRLRSAVLNELEAWATANDVSRSDAFRRIVELGLTVKTTAKPPSPARAARAKELASKAIDKMIDPGAPPEEQAQRRRRLTKGPMEFREARVDQPKAKGK